MPIILAMLLALLLMSCTQKPAPVFSTPPPNPDAPLAFFGEGNMKPEMRREYAVALQNSGFYNFALENFSEEQMENAIEIRLSYEEQKKNIYVLKAELLKQNTVWFNSTIIEEGKDKKQRRQALLERFLGEIKRVSEPPAKGCRG